MIGTARGRTVDKLENNPLHACGRNKGYKKRYFLVIYRLKFKSARVVPFKKLSVKTG